ncbi:MAG: hypothetical protein NVSMB51_11550 [Solirubrobacteraceae bacterium]
MRPLLVLVVLAALPGAASAAPGAPAGRVLATLDACHPDALKDARYATFGAQMESLRGTSAMEIRFDLLQRNPGEGRFRLVPAPGLGNWHVSAPGIGSFRYSQEIAALPAPAAFRVQAVYRWLDARKRIQHRARRLTPVCMLPDERPHLAVGAISVRSAADGLSAAYEVMVRNDGLGAAGPFDVALAVGGLPLAPIALPGLDPNTRRLVTFAGPRCAPGTIVTATLDPRGQVDETTKAGDTKSIGC